MMTTIEAIYEGGMLRPLEPVHLAEGAHVEIILVPQAPDPRRAAEILAQIADLPIQGKTDPFSGADHDKALYGTDSAT